VTEAQAVNKIRHTLSYLQDRIFPGACVFCDRPADDGRICGPCQRLLPWNKQFCERCGQAIHAAQPPGVPCAACQARSLPFDKARAPLIYAFPVDAALKAIKFKRQLWYVPPFAALLLRMIEGEFSSVDALLPVPLHRARQMKRGFNQAAELCGPLRRATGLPVISQVRRSRATSPQSGLHANQRRKNMQNAFTVAGKLRCRHPLIIDDVITTGETCSQLALTLLAAGASTVNVLTVARAMPAS
jgi:ComF family protein